MNKEQALQHLQKVFKLDSFRPNQWEVIQLLLEGNRVLFIEKTGHGKSLCYQFPATLLPGLTVVFSPLIALMRDQVSKLRALGINAECIHSDQTTDEQIGILEQAQRGELKILYISPERQENGLWQDYIKEINLNLIVIDEAHCISVWGHDFRPAFKRIAILVNQLPQYFPVLATTATATKRVEEDVLSQIGKDLKVFRGRLMRTNLRLYTVCFRDENEKLMFIADRLQHLPGNGIIYCGTRVETEVYSKWLRENGFRVGKYHGSLPTEERMIIEQGLLNNTFKAIVATNALGMGIDKPDIRFIIHTHIPQSPIHYYQEIGRAGRDDKPAEIILLYAPGDDDLPLSFIENSKPPVKLYERVIQHLKAELLSEREIIIKANLKINQFRTIKADLIDQKIIREVTFDKKKKYEFIPGSPPFSPTSFLVQREQKLNEFYTMKEYLQTSKPRMQYLCEFLGDETEALPDTCDNSGLKKLQLIDNPVWRRRVSDFRENDFPEISFKSQKEQITGYAASYYGTSDVGKMIHQTKYEGGSCFPQKLVDLTLKAIRKKSRGHCFDLVLCVPPTKSGTLVEKFAANIAKELRVPFSNQLRKVRVTEEQKVFENSYSKLSNIQDAFAYARVSDLKKKHVLLIDDIYDSGATMKELCGYLLKNGVSSVVPVTIAKTTGGDIAGTP